MDAAIIIVMGRHNRPAAVCASVCCVVCVFVRAIFVSSPLSPFI